VICADAIPKHYSIRNVKIKMRTKEKTRESYIISETVHERIQKGGTVNLHHFGKAKTENESPIKII
jgi:hypothetical protein